MQLQFLQHASRGARERHEDVPVCRGEHPAVDSVHNLQHRECAALRVQQRHAHKRLGHESARAIRTVQHSGVKDSTVDRTGGECGRSAASPSAHVHVAVEMGIRVRVFDHAPCT
jgi:hypothetical protein